MGIDTELCQSILKECEDALHYSKPLMVKHGDTKYDVTCAVGEHAARPANDVPDQPQQFPKHTHYCFDEKYTGVDKFDDLAKMLAESCSDCSLYVQKKGKKKKRSPTLTYELRCSCYKCKEKDITQFKEGCFAQSNTRPVTVKKKRTPNEKTTMDRMNNRKLKGKGVKKKTRGGSQPKRRSKPGLKEGEVILKNRTSSSRAKDQEHRCHMKLVIVMSQTNNRFYLHESSNLDHKFHFEMAEEANILTADVLNDNEEAWIQQMYESGLPNGSIAGIMTGFFNKKGHKGEFKPSVITHLTDKYQKEMDTIAGIDKDFTIAQKTIATLNA